MLAHGEDVSWGELRFGGHHAVPNVQAEKVPIGKDLEKIEELQVRKVHE